MSIDQNPRSDAGPLLIEDLLHEQHLLTPVARFSLKHESGDLPAQAKYYQDLIPLSEPKEGQQYAFAVKASNSGLGCPIRHFRTQSASPWRSAVSSASFAR